MGSPPYSPVRLADGTAIRRLKNYFKAHGALGYRILADESPDHELLDAVPLVFGLLPKDALLRRDASGPVKPLIREHLNALGFVPDEDLIDVLKAIADQYYATEHGLGLRKKT